MRAAEPGTPLRFWPANEKALVRAAWFEYRITKLTRTGNGDRYQAQESYRPAWFYFTELGYGEAQGPSLGETQRFELHKNEKRLREAERAHDDLRHTLAVNRSWNDPRKRKSLDDYAAAIRQREKRALAQKAARKRHAA